MTAPEFHGVFRHHWTAEILPRRPMILPSRHFVYPGAVEEVERGALEVLVQPGPRSQEPAEGGPPNAQFLATCALGFRDPAVPTGLWSMPDPDWLCAVSGGYAYLIDTANPASFHMLRYRPVLAVIPALFDENDPDFNGLLLFVGHRSILAWGRDGEAWESGALSAEGVTVTSIEAGRVLGLGWDLMTDKEVPFTLDMKTGARL